MEAGFQKKLAPLGLAGPVQTDFHKFVSAAQGSMGIVTRGSVKCEVLPEIHKLFFVQSRSLEDLIDFTYRILRIRFADELLIVNAFTLASIIESEPEAARALARKLPAWMVLVGIAGRNVLPEEKVIAQTKDISEIAQQFGLELVPEIAGVRNREVFNKVFHPSEQTYWKLNYKGNVQDLFFMTTLEKAPAFKDTLYAVADAHGIPSSEIDVYIQPTHQGANCHVEFSVPYDPSNQEETDQVKAFYLDATDQLMQQGAFYSRPYGIWAEKAFNRDAKTKDALLKLKNIFDPNNVMNPGKLCF
jgi:FAD/FMN-containing dehydrogenase